MEGRPMAMDCAAFRNQPRSGDRMQPRAKCAFLAHAALGIVFERQAPLGAKEPNAIRIPLEGVFVAVADEGEDPRIGVPEQATAFADLA